MHLIFRLAAPHIGDLLSEGIVTALLAPLLVSLVASIMADLSELGVQLMKAYYVQSNSEDGAARQFFTTLTLLVMPASLPFGPGEPVRWMRMRIEA